MAKKKEQPKEVKDWPPARAEAAEKKETKQADKAALVEALASLKGMNRELAELAAEHGLPDDVHVVETYLRVSAVTAEAVIKVMKESNQ